MFKFEYDRLCQAGRRDLAKKMDWPADRGETIGVTTSDPLRQTTARSGCSKSRPPTGTLARASGCPVTRLRRLRITQRAYRVRRIFDFSNGAEMFDIKPPLDVCLCSTPDKYVAVPR